MTTPSFSQLPTYKGVLLTNADWDNLCKKIIEYLTSGNYDFTLGSLTLNNEFDLSNNKIINLADPTSAKDAANKQYIDINFAALAGLETQSFSAKDGQTGKEVVNISQFPCSLNTSGYQKLPSGAIRAWGLLSSCSASGTTVSLPVAMSAIYNSGGSFARPVTVTMINSTSATVRVHRIRDDDSWSFSNISWWVEGK